MTERYPLTWPPGWPRTQHPRRAVFKTTQEKAQRELLAEIRRLGGTDWIISTNIPIRKDGLPYADADRRVSRDNGVAVYFTLKGQPKCFACDRWDTIKDNMQGIMKTIEALRGIDRWGSGKMVEAAFRGFDALPPPRAETPATPWREVFGYDADNTTITLDNLQENYRRLAKEFHPDQPGGDTAKMAAVNAAYEQAKKELSDA